jgi:hypothetical protein
VFDFIFPIGREEPFFLFKSKTLHSDYENRKEIKNALGEGEKSKVHTHVIFLGAGEITTT